MVSASPAVSEGLNSPPEKLTASLRSEATSILLDDKNPDAVMVVAPESQLDILINNNNARRADGGKDAWFFLAGCFVFEALVWGVWSNYLK